MAVIYSGTFDGIQGHKGMAIQYGIGATIGTGVTFTYPFLDTPAVFTLGDTDEHVHAASSATTGFTPTASSASSSGSGGTANWLAVGRGDKNMIHKQFSSLYGDFDYGTCEIGTATTFSNGAYSGIPIVIAGATADEGLYIASDSTTGFTPTATTGSGGSATGAAYFTFGAGPNHKTLRETSVAQFQTAPLWCEIGTYAALSALTFAYPFKSTPKIIVRPTSDGQHYAASSATTGFTPTSITLTGKGAGASGVYIALGPKDI